MRREACVRIEWSGATMWTVPGATSRIRPSHRPRSAICSPGSTPRQPPPRRSNRASARAFAPRQVVFSSTTSASRAVGRGYHARHGCQAYGVVCGLAVAGLMRKRLAGALRLSGKWRRQRQQGRRRWHRGHRRNGRSWRRERWWWRSDERRRWQRWRTDERRRRYERRRSRSGWRSVEQGGDAACTPGAKQCDGVQPQTCDTSGMWQNAGTACTCDCLDGACSATCVPGLKFCSDLQPQECAPGCIWRNVGTPCPYVCSLGTCAGSCKPGARTCSRIAAADMRRDRHLAKRRRGVWRVYELLDGHRDLHRHRGRKQLRCRQRFVRRRCPDRGARTGQTRSSPPSGNTFRPTPRR